MIRNKLTIALGVLFIALMLIPTAAVASSGQGDNQYGKLYVESSPVYADLYVDDSYMGKTPITVTLSAGTHSVQVSKSGYNSYHGSYHGTVYISEGGYTSIYPVLSSSYSYGYLSVSSAPSGASIYINNVFRGSTPYTLSLETGNYDVLVKMAGYQPYSSCVNVRNGVTSYVSASLTSDGSGGYITVYSTPSATVYVDNTYMGTTPVSGGQLYLGPLSTSQVHTVTVSASGYQSQTQQVTIASGENKVLSFNLLSDGDSSSETATIAVSSNPGGANTYLDNFYYGLTPVTLPNIKAGSHVIKLTVNGYSDYTETINVKAGENLQKSIAMSVAPAPTATAKTPIPIIGVIAGLLAAAAIVASRKP